MVPLERWLEELERAGVEEAEESTGEVRSNRLTNSTAAHCYCGSTYQRAGAPGPSGKRRLLLRYRSHLHLPWAVVVSSGVLLPTFVCANPFYYTSFI